ncbi:MAG: tRNA 2-thiocytidine biosynthesis protein TtcA [Myxococcota bacterium]|jgi:tRNA 2-thiocytidine biosynthesis protein TtcA
MERLQRRLMKLIARASKDHDMLEPGDRVMVCLSGGKDSYTMMQLLGNLQKRLPFDVSLVAVNLDQGQPGFDQKVIADWCDDHGFQHHMVMQDTYSVVLEKVPAGRTYCSLCSRMRRGALYKTAVEIGATKIALGHHRDDMIETLLLNIFYSGQIKSMPPRLRSDEGNNVIIRPLAYCPEVDIAKYAELAAFPILPCDLCGSQENLQRKQVKRLIADLTAQNEHIPGNLFASLSNIRPTHLMDRALRTALGIDHTTSGDPDVGVLSAALSPPRIPSA